MKKFLPVLCFFYIGALHAQLWQERFEDAVNQAKDENKPIVLVFSGSDWCAPCIRLKKHILDSEEFKSYASDHYVLYNADFPRKKKNQLPLEKLSVNKSLAEKYNPRGHFPLVVVLDKEQRVLGAADFYAKPAPEKYISLLNSFIQ
ncbi:thioredoxin fold domain-containing protein [Muricauda sp. JGD-17]|uniref:Thioredoxin fold domain-containing protein n=1 Tax=Flagellimonas ochracea TaxID=2696472 RepID=A0A964T8Q5_9FLAO|nr:thioredoxin family protein [Allomuricauda ochracea]NAY90302.1 thioredoxin fold domain-containing protein [Allomuricauda ochracea]